MAEENNSAAPSGATDGGNDLTIHLSLTSSPSSPRIPLTISSQDTTGARLRFLAADATSIPPGSLKLIFRGRLIGDKATGSVAEEFKLEDGCVIHCMGKPAAGGGGGSDAGATVGAPAAATAAGASVSVPAATGPSSQPPSTSAASSSPASPLQMALTKLRSSNAPPAHLTALTTLSKILTNVTANPMEEKYRRVKKGNAAFQKRLGGLDGGDDAMKASGFVVREEEGETYYVMEASADAWPKLVACQQQVNVALAEAKRATAAPAVPLPSSTTAAPGMGAGGLGGMPGMGMGGFPGAGSMPPGMENVMANMLSDPNQLQSMLQNPMVRQMMQSDPRFANNPQLRQSLDALASNPDMVRQMSQMMSDPTMRENVNRMMQAQQQGGGVGAAAPSGGAAVPGGLDPAAMQRQMAMLQQMMGAANGGGVQGTAPSPPAGNGGGGAAQQSMQQQGSTGSGNGDDQELTEEEMIAEAIARSLRES